MVYKTSCIWDKRIQKRKAEKEYGRKLLKYALFSEYGMRELPDLLYGPHGKPYFSKKEQPYFNICHTNRQIWLITGTGEVGIDVEEIRPIPVHLVKRVLSEEEKKQYDACLSEEEKNCLFFRFWTLKESFLKALGLGLTVPPSSISFTWDENQQIICYQNISEENWYFFQIQQNRTIVSVCVRSERDMWQGQWVECSFTK